MSTYFKVFFISGFSAIFMEITSFHAFSQQAQRMANDPALRGATVSAVVVDLITGEVLDSHAPELRLCPASVWKLLVGGAALDLLGADARFRTMLAYRGELKGGVLYGDVVVVGGGDPSLGSRHMGKDFQSLLKDWSEAVKAAGIDSITGGVVAVSAHFKGDGIPRTRIWEDMANYYGAAASGLNIHDNTYFIHFQTPAEPGLPAKITGAEPRVPDLRLRSEVLSSTIQSDFAFVFGAPDSREHVVRGTLPMGRERFTVKGSIPDPPLFTAYHLRLALLKAGIRLGQHISVEADELPESYLLKRIIEHQSEPLHVMVKHMLRESDNLFAETLLLQLGVMKGHPSIEGSIKVLEEHYAGIDGQRSPFFGYDGSGLSRFNAISAQALAQVLVRARQREVLHSRLLQQMPLAGKEGTVKYFAKNTNLDGNMRCKSGSMDKVRAYAGTFTAFTGRELGYVVMVNNYEGDHIAVRKAIEQWLVATYGAY